MNDIEKLISALTFESDTMTQINCEIKGRAFFPGGKGLLDGSNQISNKPIMVLGWGKWHGRANKNDTRSNMKKICNKNNGRPIPLRCELRS